MDVECVEDPCCPALPPTRPTENMLLSGSGIMKLCDFGFARQMHESEGQRYSDYVVRAEGSDGRRSSWPGQGQLWKVIGVQGGGRCCICLDPRLA